MKSIVQGLADQFQLSNDEREQLLPSGQQAIFFNRVGWARTYLKYAGLLESVGRGVVRISQSGVKLLKSHRGPICSKDLEKYNSFLEFKNKAIKTVETVSNLSEVMTVLTPQEQIEFAYEQNLVPDFLKIDTESYDLKVSHGSIGKGKKANKLIDGILAIRCEVYVEKVLKILRYLEKFLNSKQARSHTSKS